MQVEEGRRRSKKQKRKSRTWSYDFLVFVKKKKKKLGKNEREPFNFLKVKTWIKLAFLIHCKMEVFF